MSKVIDFKQIKEDMQSMEIIRLHLTRMPNCPWSEYVSAELQKYHKITSSEFYHIQTEGHTRKFDSGVITETWLSDHVTNTGNITSVAVQGGFLNEGLRLPADDYWAIDKCIEISAAAAHSASLEFIDLYNARNEHNYPPFYQMYEKIGDLEMMTFQFVDHSFSRIIRASRPVDFAELAAIDPQRILPVIKRLLLERDLEVSLRYAAESDLPSFDVAVTDISRKFLVLVDIHGNRTLLPHDGCAPAGIIRNHQELLHDLLDHFEGDDGSVEHELLATGAFAQRLQYLTPDRMGLSLVRNIVNTLCLLWPYALQATRDGGRKLVIAPAPHAEDTCLGTLKRDHLWHLFVKKNRDGDETLTEDDVVMKSWFAFAMKWIQYGYEKAIVRYSRVGCLDITEIVIDVFDPVQGFNHHDVVTCTVNLSAQRLTVERDEALPTSL